MNAITLYLNLDDRSRNEDFINGIVSWLWELFFGGGDQREIVSHVLVVFPSKFLFESLINVMVF